MEQMTYTMHVENPAGTVVQHGFHLGTMRTIAEQIVLERLKADANIVSIALRFNGRLVKIYDHRDL